MGSSQNLSTAHFVYVKKDIDRMKIKELDITNLTIESATEIALHCDLDELCNKADEVRKKYCGDKMDTCSIINARSGKCSEDCKWCSQSHKFKTGVKEYEMVDANELLSLAKRNDEYGVDKFAMVTSGRKVSLKDSEKLCNAIKHLSKETNLYLCCSMGLVDKETLIKLKEAGARRYHCNMETVSDLFPTLCSTHTQEDKRRVIRDAKSIGLEVCSGGIIGMGETMEQRVKFAFELKELDIDSVPINILNPIKGTAMENTPLITEEEIIRTVAIFRLILPDKVIRFAGGRARMSRDSQRRILKGGMNGTMIGDLLTTTGNNVAEDFKMFEECGFNC